MGDKYDYLDSWFVSDFEWSKRSLKFWKQLKKEEEELAEYKAVFTDLEDLESSINQAGKRSWPKLTTSWNNKTLAIKREDLINSIRTDFASQAVFTRLYNNPSRFNYYGYDFENYLEI